MSELTREQARLVIDQILAESCGLTEVEMAGSMTSVIKKLAKARRMAADSTTVVAKKMYSRESRFLLEMIQNAEDNSYDISRTVNEDPFIHFDLQRDRLIIDCNEDGFTTTNVQSICQVHKSSKIRNGTTRYIGEKGIGFKSVFKFASQVKIQSGPFCFRFDDEEEDGLGMLTPRNADFEVLPPLVRTRMTLTMIDPGSFAQRRQELVELPETLLLFLHKLSEVSIKVCKNDDNEAINTKHIYRFDSLTSTGSLVTTSQSGSRSQKFYIKESVQTNMPTHQDRSNITQAEIVLSFPVDQSNRPIEESQYSFAYLPMRKVGLYFQVQSDFLTQANREDLYDIPWNHRLRDGVAANFVRSMQDFCFDHPLQYEWVRYMPNENLFDPFWAHLLPAIKQRLQSVPLLQTRTQRRLKRIQELSILPLSFLDEGGEPLVPDLDNEIYISPMYAAIVINRLRQLGLKVLTYPQCLDRIEVDANSKQSILCNPSTSAIWHSKFSKKLLEMLSRDVSSYRDRIMTIPLIWLDDPTKSYASVGSGSVFWHKAGRASIPSDLGFRLVNPRVTQNAERQKLYHELGVSICPFDKVQNAIVQRYNRFGSVTLSQNVSHLQYLFHQDPARATSIDQKICLFDQNVEAVYKVFVTLGEKDLIVDDIYFALPDLYDARQIGELLRHAVSDNGPMTTIHILHAEYLQSMAADEDLQAWIHWLRTVVGVQTAPRFFNQKQKMSKLFVEILDYLPGQSVSVLKAHWHRIEDVLANDKSIQGKIQVSEVKTQSGELVPLQNTFLGTPELLQIVRGLGLTNIFPFVEIDLRLGQDVKRDWKFLADYFHVGIEADFDFYVETLLRSIGRERMGPGEASSLVTIYERLYDRITPARHEELRGKCVDRRAILTNPDTGGECIWASPEECVWDSPAFFTLRPCLSRQAVYQQSPASANLFTMFLNISNASCTDYINQLAYMSSEGVATLNASTIYKYIRDEVSNGRMSREAVRTAFDKGPLIYNPGTDVWHHRSACLWVEATNISDKIAISSFYHKLKGFFVEMLDIQQPSLDMFVTDLINKASRQRVSVEGVKDLIADINALRPGPGDLERLREVSFVPVRYPSGGVQLCTPSSHFAIANSVELSAMFSDSAPILDLDLVQVHRHLPFIDAMGWGNRFMSECIQEASDPGQASLTIDRTMDFRNRAFALLTCTMFFRTGSDLDHPDHDCYDRLLNSEIFLSDSITKQVGLVVNGALLATQSTQGKLHIKKRESHFEIYLPKDEVQRTRCMHQELPKQLMEALEIPASPLAMSTIKSVLQEVKIGLLDLLLSDANIIAPRNITRRDPPQLATVPSIIALPVLDQADSIRAAPNPSRPQTPDISEYSLSSSPSTPATSYHSPAAPAPRHLRSPNGSATYLSPAQRLEFNPPQPNVGELSARQMEGYANLLGTIIAAAQQAGCRDTLEWWAIDNEQELFDDGGIVGAEIFGIRSQNQRAPDCRIGAAGELFVFELLKNGMPNGRLTTRNWKSNVRHHVAVQDNYKDLESWNGPETADIVYDDVGGEFSEMLVQKAGISPDTFPAPGEGHVKYFFEVKTTIADRNEKFYMSRSQCKRMKSMVIRPGHPCKNIYIIFRVFRLGQRGMGMRMMIDPETYRREEKLQFTADSYTVQPL